jgi:choice-of-anchor A domain-containing protein
MYEYGNVGKTCHFEYKNGCTLNSEACPHEQPVLENNFLYTNGDFKHEEDLDLDRWADEITLLQQKATFWKSLEPNGVVETEDKLMTLKASSNNSPVQIFKIAPISEDIQTLVFSKSLHGKTILIIIDDEDDFEFVTPNMCFVDIDSVNGDNFICDKSSFPVTLTSSIAWLLPHEGMATVSGGDHEFFGSIVAPWGSVTASVMGQSGRFIVGGDMIIDGAFTELHNYEFDPHNHPLPLGDDLDEYCEVQEPVCVENYKALTSTTVCPSRPEGVVSVIHSSHELPDEDIIYNIIMDPSEEDSAKTLKFQVDNPFANHTDIFIKHVKKVGKYAMDPVCDSMPFTAGCSYDAPVIEIGCHEYDGVDAFALVNLYFASNSDSFVADAGSDDVTIDKCCKPPEEYREDGYGIIEVTLEIKCVCPDGATSA